MANKRQRKKRLKKLNLMEQLAQKKFIEVAPAEPVALIKEPEIIPVMAETKSEYPRQDLYIGKYEAENKEYQALLDKRYKGTVKPIERFTNLQSTILHHCSDCNLEWFSKPLWLLTKVNQEHICGVDTARAKPKKKLTENDIVKVCVMAEQGISMTKIANHFSISRSTVISHLRKAGLK